ncbi:MAG: FKBP-type peptidyl-prolyl cis-trans isomerase [Prevotellaceae bacterium]|nr:FKBP-type peptidyl-prolyl cis-trans isomerase [Prevotellaceae bacterium]
MRTVFGLIVTALLCVSCSKENPIESQETKIEAYIKSRMNSDKDLKLSKSGAVCYLSKSGDTTVNLANGDSVYFYYRAALLTDTARYFDTNERARAEGLGMNLEGRSFDPAGVIVGRNNLLEGLGRGLQMAHPNDLGEIVFNSDYGFGGKPNGIVPANAPLIYKIRIVRVTKN